MMSMACLMRDNNWIIPQDGESWRVLAEEVNAALATPFTSKTCESTKPHHAGFSFLEALALAAVGGTIPLARFILDRSQRERLSEQDWRFVAVVIWSLQQPYEQGRGRPYRLERTKAEYAERKAAQLVARLQANWRAQHKRKRVPVDETNKMIARAIEKAAAELKVPVPKIKLGNVRNLLKSGRN